MSSESNTQSKPRLLIVDDEAINVQLLTRLFKQSFVVDSATEGQVALDMMQTNNYDIVLLDIMMSGMNGLDVLRTIRRTKNISELPIILISAMTERAEVARGIKLGANDYIAKPLDVDVVRARITTQIMMKQLMDERHRHIDQLQEMNEVRARMMQVASHDLKNPLNNLKMLTQVMRDEAENPERIHEFAGMLDNSLTAMLSVIEDFLDNQFVTHQDFAISMQPVDTQKIVEEVVNQYAVAAHNKQITLQVDEQISCQILADARRLQQVLGNLVSNAIKYSPTGSQVTIHCAEHDGKWRLQVIDQGPGIPKAEHPHLFQPFSKNKISTQPTAGESSTGLGLWIVKQMIELQEGKVGVEFPEAGGSIFWLELTLASHAAET